MFAFGTYFPSELKGVHSINLDFVFHVNVLRAKAMLQMYEWVKIRLLHF